MSKVKVRNEGRRWVGDDHGQPLIVEAGADALVSEDVAESLPREFVRVMEKAKAGE